MSFSTFHQLSNKTIYNLLVCRFQVKLVGVSDCCRGQKCQCATFNLHVFKLIKQMHTSANFCYNLYIRLINPNNFQYNKSSKGLTGSNLAVGVVGAGVCGSGWLWFQALLIVSWLAQRPKMIAFTGNFWLVYLEMQKSINKKYLIDIKFNYKNANFKTQYK